MSRTVLLALLRELPDRLATAAGVILFTGRRRSGLVFLGALALDPNRLALALGGALAGMAAGGLAARSPVWQKLGLFGGSGLLTALALAAYLPPGPAVYGLTAFCAALSALLLLACAPLLARLDLPVLAMPFVLAALLGLAAAPVLGFRTLGAHGIDHWLFPGLEEMNHALSVIAPYWLDALLRTLGSLLFLPEPLAGLVILVCVKPNSMRLRFRTGPQTNCFLICTWARFFPTSSPPESIWGSTPTTRGLPTR